MRILHTMHILFTSIGNRLSSLLHQMTMKAFAVALADLADFALLSLLLLYAVCVGVTEKGTSTPHMPDASAIYCLDFCSNQQWRHVQ